MSDEDRTAGIRDGAAAGAAAWLAYGAVETAFVTIVPRLFPQAIDFRYLHHGWAALLLLLYAAAGTALGAGIAAGLRRAGGGAAAAVAAATVPIACMVNLIALFGLPPEGLPLAFLAVAAGTAIVQLASARAAWRPRLRFAASPWTAAFLLTGPAWITKDFLQAYRSTGSRAGAALAFCAGVLVVAAVADRLRRGGSGAARPFAALGRAAALAVVVLGIGVALNRVPTAGGTVAGPPVVLVVLDTVRADHVSLDAAQPGATPRLAELARDAIVFPRSVAAGDMTLSTHASLFTGLLPREHGAHHADPASAEASGGLPGLAERFDTLAERLRQNGYRSYAVIANHGYLAPIFDLGQGFDYWDSRAAAGWTSDRYLLRYGVRELVRRTPRSRFERDRPFRSADDIRDEVDALMDRLGDRLDGAFLFVNFMDAHFPYLPPPPFDAMFPGRDPSLTVQRLDRRRRDIALKGGELTEAERAHLLSQYDGAIAYLDSRVGMLIDRLKAIGAYDRALVIVTSDHGEAFGERGLIDHGVSAYQDQVGVPLLVKPPGGGRGAVDGRVTSSVDVLPTALDAVGMAPPDSLSGRSLLEPAAEGRAVIAEHYPSEMFVKAGAPSGQVQRAIREGDRKLVRAADGRTELFDLAADPDETHDLSGDRPGDVVELAGRLDAWLAATQETQGSGATPDADVNERLKALGYVQ